MIFNMSGGGGTTSLNFKVVAVASELLLPASTQENTIAVITDTAINGWVFSADEPESPAEGMVWFKTGTSAATPFDAIKKNGLWVYPAACQQYVDGALVDKTAKTYQGGAWVDWIMYLFNSGSECTNITGGWSFGEESGYFNTGTGSNDGYNISMSVSGTQLIVAYTNNLIDLTSFSTIRAYVSSAYNAQLSLRAAEDGDVKDAGYGEDCKADFTGSNPGEILLDISAINGLRRVAFTLGIEGGSSSAKISEVVLE